MSNSPVPQVQGARSPFAGCLIFIVAGLVMLFLIGFSVLTLFRQFAEIAKFTATEPAPIQVSSLTGQEAALNSLAERIEAFHQQLAGDTDASLTLTADDLNLAIAAYEPFKELRNTFRVSRIGENHLEATISFPLNGKPRFTQSGESGWITSDMRYLNGTLVTTPQRIKNEITLQIHQIVVPGKTVATGFIEQMSPYRITERYITDPVIGPAMAKLTRVEISGETLVLSRKKGETLDDTITAAEVDTASTRLFTTLGLAALVFLTFVAIVLVIGLRARRKQSQL